MGEGNLDNLPQSKGDDDETPVLARRLPACCIKPLRRSARILLEILDMVL